MLTQAIESIFSAREIGLRCFFAVPLLRLAKLGCFPPCRVSTLIKFSLRLGFLRLGSFLYLALMLCVAPFFHSIKIANSFAFLALSLVFRKFFSLNNDGMARKSIFI